MRGLRDVFILPIFGSEGVSVESKAMRQSRVSSHLPLESNEKYCAETDTLTIGDELETATLIAENGDLVLYWRPDRNYPDELTAIAIDIRNASRHLAPAVAANKHKQANTSQKYMETVR